MRNLTRLSTFALLAACGSKSSSDQAAPSPPPAPTAPTPAPASPPTSTVATGSGAPLVAPSMNVAPFANQLAYEAAHRPANGLAVEKVFDALGSAGFTFKQREQVLGIKMKASYCMSALTPSLTVVACEYPTPSDATAAVAMMTNYMKQAPDFRFVAHQNLMVTLRGYIDPKTPDLGRAIQELSKL